MSFIYGIINLSGEKVNQEEIRTLGHAVKWEDFTEQNLLFHNVAFGICTHPQCHPKAGIYHDDRIILAADIRIYNVEILKKQFDFKSAEEAFAKAYRCWGVQCADHINGDFSVVLYDRHTNEAHLFRDHIGARPLTHYYSKNRLIFASHEFGMAKSRLFPTKLSEEILINRLFRYQGNYVQTIFKDIYRTEPGCCHTFTTKKILKTNYWKPEEIKQNKKLSIEETVSILRTKLISSTLIRVEQGRTGVHVSGGIDSSGIAAILADKMDDKSELVGYSWTPEGYKGEIDGVNEKEFIEAFSADKKVLIRYTQSADKEYINDLLVPECECMPNEQSTMRNACKDEIKTLFSGWGGDEFVSLSNRGTCNHLFFKLKWMKLVRFIRKKGIRTGINLFRMEILPLIIPFGLLHFQPISRWSNLSLLKRDFIRKHWKILLFNPQKSILGFGNRTQFMINSLNRNHLANRMDSWAMNSERYGFDYKYPLLDKDLLEFWFSIPIEYTYDKTPSRLLFREALKGILTEKIRLRKNKDEALFEANLLLNLQIGIKNIKSQLAAIPPNNCLSFLKPEKFIELLNQKPEKKPYKEYYKIAKTLFYLRHLNLVNKYLIQDNPPNPS